MEFIDTKVQILKKGVCDNNPELFQEIDYKFTLLENKVSEAINKINLRNNRNNNNGTPSYMQGTQSSENKRNFMLNENVNYQTKEINQNDIDNGRKINIKLDYDFEDQGSKFHFAVDDDLYVNKIRDNIIGSRFNSVYDKKLLAVDNIIPKNKNDLISILREKAQGSFNSYVTFTFKN